MDRKALLLKHIDPATPGIEIAPYFNPVLAKRDGHPVLTLDVFDTATLRERALKDRNIPDSRIDEIEEVDIVSDACSLGESITRMGRAGQFGYVMSSHNFEHLPDPIRFLQGCSIALQPGGIVSMAVPDCRACFDHFRMPTRLSDWLRAYHERHDQPSPESIFDMAANMAEYFRDGVPATGCDIRFDDPSRFLPRNDLRSAYAEYRSQLAAKQPYRDTHVTVTFGVALENLLSDLRFLGLIDLDVIEVTETLGLEFFVHLRKPATPAPLDEAGFYAARAARQRKIADSLGTSGYGRPGPGQTAGQLWSIKVRRRVKSALVSLLPADTYAALRTWNRRRKARRS